MQQGFYLQKSPEMQMQYFATSVLLHLIGLFSKDHRAAVRVPGKSKYPASKRSPGLSGYITWTRRQCKGATSDNTLET